MREIFKNSFGFTMVGALVASSIGAVAVVGLARLSSTIINTLNKSRKETNMMELSQDIKRVFQGGHDPNCDIHDPSTNCWNACTSSLIGYSTGAGGSISIKAPDPLPNPSPLPSSISAGSEVYKGGEIYKGIRIQNIQYVPSPIPNRADVTVHFSPSDDTRETLTAPQGLHFSIFIDELSSSNTIERCTVASAEIVGAGAIGIVKDCRKVGMGKTLVGCGGTTEISGSGVTAFGYRTGKDSKNSTGGSGSKTSFLGTEAGKKNEGDENIFIGYQAGLENKEGKGNLFLGYKAGKNNTKGIYNMVIGKETEVPDGAEERDRLNIADIIKGKFRNKEVSPSDPILGTTPSLPEILFEKGPVHIEPSTPPTPLSTPRLPRHPDPDPPSTPPLKFTLSELDKSKVPVGLHIVGEMHIKNASNEVKIKADQLGSPYALNPNMIIDGANKLQLRTGAVLYESSSSTLTINRNLNVFGVRIGDGGAEPGLTTSQTVNLNPRPPAKASDPTKTSVKLTAAGSQLKINGDLTVKGEGGGANSEISDNLRVKRHLFVDGLGTLTKLKLDDDGTADFGKLIVRGKTTIPQIQISNAKFETTITDIIEASITNTDGLDGGDGHLSHIHPSGNASLNTNRTPNHNHDRQYSRPGHIHPNGSCGGGTPRERRLCMNCPSPDRDCRACPCGPPPCPPWTCPTPCPPITPSSRTLKRNIKPFKDYAKSLKDIAATPLFTYQYKKNKGEYPEKPRMGIISEELPKDLQIMTTLNSETACETNKKQKDLQAKKKEERKENKKISIPDWLSIYGTLWAGIKAFAGQLEDFKKENAVKLTELSKELKTHLADQMALLKKEITSQLERLKKETAETEKALAKHSKEVAGAARELSELKKQFEKDLLPLQNNWQEELQKTREEMDAIQKQLKQNLSFHPAKKSTLEARSR